MTITISSPITKALTTTWNGSSYDDTQAFTVGASDNIITVFISGLWHSAPTVTYNGSPLLLQHSLVDGHGGCLHAYDLLNPTTGSNNLVIDSGGTTRTLNSVIYSLSGVDGTTPRGTPQEIDIPAASSTLTFATTAGDYVVDGLAHPDTATATVGAGQTLGANALTGVAGFRLSTSHEEAATTSTDASWTLSGSVNLMHIGLHYIAAATSETATTGNIPLTIQADYTLVDLVDPVTTNASLLFGVTGDTPVTGDHLEYDITSVLDSGVTLSVAASGVWTVTEATEGDWVTDITVSRRVVQADGTIGTEAVVTLEATTGATISNIDGDNDVFAGQTGAVITTSGISSTSVTQGATLGSKSITITNWS